MSDRLSDDALAYHRLPVPGKLAISATKPLASQHDLSLAYSPGVAAACDAIAADPAEASSLTARSNLVAVVTNGTAVLGLGAIGPLAAKPVMEGKAVLFKKFSGIDVFDIEVDETDPDRFCDIVASLEPTFGGINLEDIRAPECFEIESRLRARMNIPVLHDDQHGTAIIVGAAVRNALELVGKSIGEVRLVASGAGAAALACLDLLLSMGLRRENVVVTDVAGVVYTGREALMDRWKARYAVDTGARTLADVIGGADIFLGLSAPRVLEPEHVGRMAESPIILALANPEPEILPDLARGARRDAIVATGRSDYPNQVNNVLCFPFIFRGALDAGATDINDTMKLACVDALAGLARREPSDLVTTAYGGRWSRFGPSMLIPRPFDPRLLTEIAPAVARAAMSSGVATRPIDDFDAYRERLTGFVFRSGLVMKPLFERARNAPKRVIYHGEFVLMFAAVSERSMKVRALCVGDQGGGWTLDGAGIVPPYRGPAGAREPESGSCGHERPYPARAEGGRAEDGWERGRRGQPGAGAGAALSVILSQSSSRLGFLARVRMVSATASPRALMRPMAKRRSRVMFSGPWPERIRLRSSSKLQSRMWWVASMVQCPRWRASRRCGGAAPEVRLVMP